MIRSLFVCRPFSHGVGAGAEEWNSGLVALNSPCDSVVLLPMTSDRPDGNARLSAKHFLYVP